MEASEQLARRSQGLCGEEYERCDALKILWNNEVGAGFEVLQTFDSSNSGTYRDHARGLRAGLVATVPNPHLRIWPGRYPVLLQQ